MTLQPSFVRLQAQPPEQLLQTAAQSTSNAVTPGRPSKRNKKSGLPVMKACGGHTPDNFSLRTDVSYSFVTRGKVTLASGLYSVEAQRGENCLVSVGRFLSVFAPLRRRETFPRATRGIEDVFS